MNGMKRWIPFVKSEPVVAVVRLQGMIANNRGGLSDQSLGPVIEKAFSRGKPAAVALEINSPGGSPVQSSLIAARIRRLADDKNIPVLAFVEDVAASGGYWLAVAADEIFADPSSIIGSIGVISAGFGAHELLERHGVERRIYTAGESKSKLDMFKPEQPKDVAQLQSLLGDVHENFIDHVKARRGGKLDQDANLFNGDYWLAQRAQALGLIDGIGHLKPILKERFGDKVQLRRYGVRRPFLSRFGAQVMDDALASVQERAAFAQFGL